MIVYEENMNKSRKNTLELLTEYCKFAGYKGDNKVKSFPVYQPRTIWATKQSYWLEPEV